MDKTLHYPEFTGKKCKSYVISSNDTEVVNLAIKLNKPLVIEGEPGCGKTALAHAIGEEFGIPVKVFPVKSISRANDLLYRFDALRRLQDSQTQIEKNLKKAEFAHNYVQLEYLGSAIYEGKKCVILIDEIDKADIDFPDDLLHVLTEFEFPIIEIPEDETDTAKSAGKYGSFVSGPKDSARPIVIFTSNRTKPLSNPFLRRCFHLELNFPDNLQSLAEIVNINLTGRKSKMQGIESISNDLITSAVETFLKIRKEARLNNITKLPATAELIDWLHVLHIHSINQKKLENTQPPYWKLLFKVAEDRKRYEEITSPTETPSS